LLAQEPERRIPAAPELPYVERQEKQFDFYPGGRLEITAALPGNLKIVGWRKASIRLEVEKIVYNLPPDEAKALAHGHPIQVSWNQTTATIRTVGPEQSAAMEINLSLYVPSDKTDIDVNLGQGDFSIEGINGWIEATLGDGSVEAKSMSGYFSTITKRGDIRVEMSGNRWRGLEFGALTELGSVDLRLPSGYSANLQLETRDGNLAVSYPPRSLNGNQIPLQVATHKKVQSLSTDIGEGGPPIRIITKSGDVTLSQTDR